MVYSPKVNADGSYASLTGFAVKVGDKYTSAGISGKALVRLPKDDETYDYYDPSTGNLGGVKHDDINRTDDGKGNLIIASVEPSSKEGAIGAVDVTRLQIPIREQVMEIIIISPTTRIWQR